MDYQIRAESGRQFLARLSNRPSLAKLDERLLGGGPLPRDVIEVTGEASVGKSLLLLQWTARAILAPARGGLGAGILFIDTDHHQPLSTLVNLLEAQVKSHLSKIAPRCRLSSSMVEASIEDALTRLTILSVYDSTQLLTGLLALDKTLQSNPLISMVVIDSLPAFFWADRLSGGLQHMDSYLKRLLAAVQKSTQIHKVSVVFTRPAHFQSAGTSRGVGSTVYINLKRMEDSGLSDPSSSSSDVESKRKESYYAMVRSATGQCVLRYQICKGGFVWL